MTHSGKDAAGPGFGSESVFLNVPLASSEAPPQSLQPPGDQARNRNWPQKEEGPGSGGRAVPWSSGQPVWALTSQLCGTAWRSLWTKHSDV